VLTAVLTIRGFDTVGTVCPIGFVFGHSEGEEKLALPFRGQGFLRLVCDPDCLPLTGPTMLLRCLGGK
jgi:hypothetical protein